MKTEIGSQYEEINALYEETLALNESQDELLQEIHDSYSLTIKALSNALEANDLYTNSHSKRVSEIAVDIGEAIGLSASEIRNLEYAAVLHDIGKVGVPYHIINKEGRLTDEEFESIKGHPSIGYKILKDIPFLKQVADIVLQHHERFDGKGYPNGVEGNNINILSRIISIADSYDAMTSSRSYRKIPLTNDQAEAELKLGSGTQFDPDLVVAFLRTNTIVTQDQIDVLFDSSQIR